MSKKVSLSVTQVMTDGQDGGYSLCFYKDEETAKRLIKEDSCLEEDEEIDWTDEYQNGYFSERTLTFILNDDNTLSLPADEMFVGSFGQ